MTSDSKRANYVPIYGNTYPVKDQLKALGGRWDPGQRAWKVPEEKVEAARKLVAEAPVKTSSPNAIRYRRRRQPCGYPGCDGIDFCDNCSE